MKLKNDILKVLGFTYGNPDVSPICTVQVRDEVLVVVEKHMSKLREFFKANDEVIYSECSPESVKIYKEKKKEVFEE